MDCANGTLLVTGIWALVFVKCIELWLYITGDEQ